MLLPPPYDVIVGMGLGMLGAFFPTKEDGTLTLTEIGNILRGIDERLGNMEAAIGELTKAMQVVTALTQYTILVVDQINQKLWVDPFHNIHAAYMNLIETYMPMSDNDSWDMFFEKANILRGELEAEVYDAFESANIRKYLEWYEASVVNDSGMCGQAMMYEYLMVVRAELFFITSYGSFVQSDPEQDCVDGKFCWEQNSVLLSRYATKYHKQMNEYQQILTAQRAGGLGIAHLVNKSFSELLEGIQEDSDGLELGFCFKCDKDYSMPSPSLLSHCNRTLSRSPNPSQEENEGEASADQQLGDKIGCNSKTFTIDWAYWDRKSCLTSYNEASRRDPSRCGWSTYVSRGTKRHAILGEAKSLGCCTCSCMSGDDYDGKFGGTAADHTKYDRHCPCHEEILAGFVSWLNSFRANRQGRDSYPHILAPV